MAKARGWFSKYRWFLALAGGVALYLLYPSSLPFLLLGGMMLMHLGGHGGHGHGSHRHDPEGSGPPEGVAPPPSHNHGNHPDGPKSEQPGRTGTTPAKTYKAGFEAHPPSEPAPEEGPKPHRHRGC